MRERLYLETMQEIFSRASKVMVDAGKSNNMLYLPLDKIMQQAAQDAGRQGNTLSVPGAAQPSVPPAPARTGAPSTPSGNSSGNTNTLPRDRLSR